MKRPSLTWLAVVFAVGAPAGVHAAPATAASAAAADAPGATPVPASAAPVPAPAPASPDEARAAALLDEGMHKMAASDFAAAHTIFADVMLRYPGTSAAVTARSMLDVAAARMKEAPPPKT